MDAQPAAITELHLRALAAYRHSLDLDDRERDKWHKQLGMEDPELHAAVMALVASHATRHLLDAPLQHPPAEPVPASSADDPRPGTRLGAWRIDRLIADGGMGSVYEAHRADGQYEQRVALKCMRMGLGTPELVRAFIAERNHLALLVHPNIAPLMDGGVDADGHPWFAMQYVDGLPIDAWCDERKLPLTDRVRLILKTCDALNYAHSQGVLHQDIKPSNLLVEESGEVKLLDFGLSARMLSGSASSAPPIAITPGYTAPEIAFDGGFPSVASDIHSLGILLCRLLSGAIPSSLFLDQLARHVRPAPPRRLPDLVRDAAPETARQRASRNTAALMRQLSGDLEAIAARCIDPLPERRYPAVSALASDLRRWLEQRPVSARDGGWRYRSGLFVRRHRMAVSLLGTLALSLGIGTATMIWQTHRATREAKASQAVSALFEETLGMATLSGLDETPFSSAALLRQTETRMRELRLEQYPQTQARALNVLANAYATIGDYRHASFLAEQAARNLSYSEAQATLASLLNIQARYTEAQQVSSAALDTLGSSRRYRPARLRLLTESARSQWGLTQRDQATHALDSAFALARKQQAEDPTPYIELLIIRAHWQRQMLRWTASETDLRQAIALAGSRYPLLADEARQSLSLTLRLLDRNPEARQVAMQSLESRRTTLGERHPKTGEAWLQLAGSQRNVGRSEEFAESVTRGTAIVRATYGERHPTYAYALMLSSSLPASAQASPYPEAVKNLRRAQEILREAYGPEHSEFLLYQGYLGSLLMTPPVDLPSRERERLRREGLALLERTVTSANRLKLPIPHVKMTLAEVMIARNRPGDLARAQWLLDECRVEAAGLPQEHPIPGRVAYIQATLLYASGALAEADATLEPLMRRAEQGLPALNARLLLFRVLPLRAAIAAKRNRPQQAHRFLLEMHEASVRLLGAEHATTRGVAQQLDDFAQTGRIELRQWQ